MSENIKDIIAIDIHTHYNHGSKYDTTELDYYKCDIDFLMKEYDNANIKCGVYSSFASVLSDKEILAENEHLYNLSQENERVFQWVVIDPRQEETFSQADEILKSDKCIGIKIHPDGHGYGKEMLSFADKIFDFANERKTTVMMHPAWNENMPEFANKYPNMNLIIAHLGGINQVRQAKYGNIYIDTSGSSSNMNNVIEEAVKVAGSEKILFGTDTYSCAFQRGRIEYARIPFEDKVNILRNNALRLFEKFK